MITHPTAALPAYVNGTLGRGDRAEVAAHLAACPACRAELADWQAVAGATAALARAVGAPGDDLLAKVEAQPPARLPAPAAVASLRPVVAPGRWPVRRLTALVRGQVPLIRRGLWLASPLVFLVGTAVALAAPSATNAGLVLSLLAPVVAAVGVALVYGPENDPGLEIALSTPTSPRAVLLARLVLVLGYDLALALLANTVVAAVDPQLAFWPLVSSWLAPMLLLSSLSLLLSLVAGTVPAVSVALTLWALRLLSSAGGRGDGLGAPARWVWDVGMSGPLAWPLAATLALAALWWAPRREMTS